ncbi:MAG: hypothetical protein Q8P67_15780 [archaeon]|nr:hypothetical protein [archaeon]
MGNAIKFPEAPSITWGGEAYYIENQLNPVPLPKSKAASPEGLEASGASNAAVAGSLHSPSSSALNLSVAFKNEFHGGRVYTLANENFSKHLALKIYLKYYSVEVINWLLLRRELLIKLSGAPYIVPLYKCYQVRSPLQKNRRRRRRERRRKTLILIFNLILKG